MFWAILAVVLIIAGCIVSYIFKHWLPASAAALAAILILVFSCVTIVPTGFTGVLTTFGRVEDTTLDAGINFKAPWQKIVTMDNREQRYTFAFEAFSSDIQQTSLSGSVNFNIDKQTAMTLYREIGSNYTNILMSPRLFENTKTVFSHYTAENLISKRDILADEILTLMRADMEDYGVNIISISIEDIDFTDAFTNAIEAKQVATQDKLRAQTVQEQMVMEAESNAKQRTIAANADAEVARITADAEAYSITTKANAEATANMAINKSLTPELIKYVQANGWNGILPSTFVGDDEALPIINIDTVNE